MYIQKIEYKKRLQDVFCDLGPCEKGKSDIETDVWENDKDVDYDKSFQSDFLPSERGSSSYIIILGCVSGKEKKLFAHKLND